MISRIPASLAGASLLVLASPVLAQTTPAPAAQPEAASTSVTEVVVTARRKEERLQEVPATVNAVSADTVQKLNITQFTDISNVVPGLSLQQNNSGYQAAASLRGVTFDVNTGNQPTVAMYMNDAPVQALFLFDSLYDVGQVEVLRGPQGTTRGVSAPSGAITLTTHQANLYQFGGYVDASRSNQDASNLQGAVNIPIIKDVFAIRLAGVFDQNHFDNTRSVNDGDPSWQTTSGGRITARFEPNDAFKATVTYSHLDKVLESYDPVSGPGQATSAQPAISASQRLSVENGRNTARTHTDVITGQVDSYVFGQRLSYVGSYQHEHIDSLQNNNTGDDIPDVNFYGHTQTSSEQTTQEIRLSSDPVPAERFWDYTVGAFYNWQQNTGHVSRIGPLLPGAFGTPLGPVDYTAFNPNYEVPLGIDIPSTLQETSVFGTVYLHLPFDTEFSAGLRQMWSIVNSETKIATENGLVALTPSTFGAATCAAAGLPSTYPGVCDFAIAGSTVSDVRYHASKTPLIYNVSLSHHFNRDLLVYGTIGSAYRPPNNSIGIVGDLATSTDPALQNLNFHPAETSTSYELGVKTTFFNNHGRFNVSVFRQDFKNLTIYVPNVNYVNTAQGDAVSAFSFTDSVNATVQGFDIDTAYQITRNWSVSLQGSYSDGQVKGSLVPCNLGTATAPIFNTDGLISLCKGGSTSRLPYWSATLSSEYTRPLWNGLDGFVRGLLTYYPENKNRAEPDFTVGAYSNVNLYVGVRAHDGSWEISAFAKNAFDTQRTLDRSPVALNDSTQLGTAYPGLEPAGGSGYYQTTVTPKQEFGVDLRYYWGAH